MIRQRQLHPPSLLREFYHKRCGIKTSFRDLKYFDRKVPASCPAWPAKVEEYARFYLVLFSDVSVYETAYEIISRRRLHWSGYLNEIRLSWRLE